MTERERDEEGARESDTSLPLLLESIPDSGLFMLDGEGRIVGWNRGAERLMRYTEDEVRGRHVSVFYPPEDADGRRPELALQAAEREQRVEDRGWLVRNGGSRFWADVVISALRAPDGRVIGFAVVARDLTERKSAEAEREALLHDLRAARARLQATLDSSLDAIVTIDEGSVILAWNRPAEAIFGWSAEEALGKQLSDTIIPPRYREAHARGMQRYLETGEGPILNSRIEITALRRDGHELPVELTVAPATSGGDVVFNAFIRDLTEQKQIERRTAAEHAVTRALAESRTLEEAAPRVLEAIGEALGWTLGAFWVVDRQADVVRCRAVWQHPGVPVREFAAATGPMTLGRGVGLPGRVWESRAPVWITDIEHDPNFPRASIAAHDGLHGAFAFPVLSGDEFLGVIEFFHTEALEPDDALLQSMDIIGRGIAQAIARVEAEGQRDRALSEVKRINVHLKEANAELAERTMEAEAANRAKTDFLANMSHELRTPMNAIMGYTELLDMGIAGPVSEGQKTQLDRVRKSSRHLLGLIDDILDLSRIEARQMTIARDRIRIGDLIEDSIALVEPQARERGLDVTDACRGDADRFFIGDGDRTRQILVNLLANAVKFTDPGGAITVRCGLATDPEPGSSPEGAGPWLYVEVEDTGIGISPQNIGPIFEPFIQVEPSLTRTKGGAGLGLSISRRLARLMGGDLTARSEPGKGASFRLYLPAD